MLLSDVQMDSVVFVCVEKMTKSGQLAVVPTATAFIVVDDLHGEPRSVFVVTARHVVEEARAARETEGPGGRMFVRANGKEHFVDIQTDPDDWHESDEADVAVCLFRPVEGETIYAGAVLARQIVDENYCFRFGKSLPPGTLSSVTDDPCHVGAEVLFVGLFSRHAGSERNLPVARFGNVSRMPGEPIPVARPDKTDRLVAYLVEAKSWGGHSGSPAWWRQPVTQIEQKVPPGNRAEKRKQRPIPVSTEVGFFAVLGLVSAHFDIPQRATTESDDVGKIETGINSGMAVVTPGHFITRLLDSVPVREQIEGLEAEGEPVATMDFDTPDEDVEQSEWERFEELAEQVVSTPKPADDED